MDGGPRRFHRRPPCHAADATAAAAPHPARRNPPPPAPTTTHNSQHSTSAMKAPQRCAPNCAFAWPLAVAAWPLATDVDAPVLPLLLPLCLVRRELASTLHPEPQFASLNRHPSCCPLHQQIPTPQPHKAAAAWLRGPLTAPWRGRWRLPLARWQRTWRRPCRPCPPCCRCCALAARSCPARCTRT